MSLVYLKRKTTTYDATESDVQELQIKKDEIESSITKEKLMAWHKPKPADSGGMKTLF